jgi:outer membrane murein-binding lipoprotein Lpp
MKKLWKYIVGFFTFVVGLLVLSGRKNKKVKKLNKDIKNVNKSIKQRKKDINVIDKKIKGKKENLKKIKSKKYVKKKKGKKETEEFLKNFANKK